MPRIGVSPCIRGLSWLAVLYTATTPSLFLTSHAQPLPKRVVPAAANAFLKPSKLPHAASIAAARAPLGSPPPPGPITDQNSEWLAWPPPLFCTAVRMSAGTLEILRISFSMSQLSKLGAGNGGVEIGDVGGVVLVMVDSHGLGIDMRLQSVVGVRQRRDLEGHVLLLVTGWLSKWNYLCGKVPSPPEGVNRGAPRRPALRVRWRGCASGPAARHPAALNCACRPHARWGARWLATMSRAAARSAHPINATRSALVSGKPAR